MPDTPANQKAYPQHPRQSAGVGFPLARIAVMFSLYAGTMLTMDICRYKGKGQSELGLLRGMWNMLVHGDVLITDRYLCSYFEMALLKLRGVDMVARLHQGRKADFRRGQRIARDDHLVVWVKPLRRPWWMDAATYATLPEEMIVREVRVRVQQRGFRTREVIVDTTLLDAEQYPAAELAAVYRARWHAELDLRSLKETLQMDMLRTETPEMVRKEI